jgi:hypothetical protein
MVAKIEDINKMDGIVESGLYYQVETSNIMKNNAFIKTPDY